MIGVVWARLDDGDDRLRINEAREVVHMSMGVITNDALAGRVLVLWTGKPAGLIPVGDPGYSALEGWPSEGSKLVAP